jgi:hypothetical protein
MAPLNKLVILRPKMQQSSSVLSLIMDGKHFCVGCDSASEKKWRDQSCSPGDIIGMILNYSRSPKFLLIKSSVSLVPMITKPGHLSYFLIQQKESLNLRRKISSNSPPVKNYTLFCRTMASRFLEISSLTIIET